MDASVRFRGLVDSASSASTDGRFATAALTLTRAQRLADSVQGVDDEDRYAYFLTLGSLAFDAGVYDVALETYASVLHDDEWENVDKDGKSVEFTRSLMLAHTLKKMGDTALSLRWYRHALQFALLNSKRDVFNNIGSLECILGNYSTALTYLDSAQQAAWTGWERDYNGRVWELFVRARCYAGLGRDAEVRRMIESGLTILRANTKHRDRAEADVQQSIITSLLEAPELARATDAAWRRELNAIRAADSTFVAHVHPEEHITVPSSNALRSLLHVRGKTSVESQAKPIDPLWVVDSVIDGRGWRWLATLSGVQLQLGPTMIHVERAKVTSHAAACKHVRIVDDAMIVTRYSGKVDTLNMTSLVHHSSSHVPTTRRLPVWQLHPIVDALPTALVQLRDGRVLWCYQHGCGIGTVTKPPSTITAYVASGQPWNGVVQCGYALNDSVVVMGTGRGLWSYAMKTQSLQRIRTGSALDDESITSIYNQNQTLLVAPEYSPWVKFPLQRSGVVAWEEGRTAPASSDRPWLGRGGGVTDFLHTRALVGQRDVVSDDVHDAVRDDVHDAVRDGAHDDVRDKAREKARDKARDNMRVDESSETSTRSAVQQSRSRTASPSYGVVGDGLYVMLHDATLQVLDHERNRLDLHTLPASMQQRATTQRIQFVMADSTIVVLRDDGILTFKVSAIGVHPGTSIVGLRLTADSAYTIYADAADITLPTSDRTFDVVLGRPAVYGNHEIPLRYETSWDRHIQPGFVGRQQTIVASGPGQFIVAITSADGTATVPVTVIVQPAITETWWFFTLLAVGAVVIVYVSVRYLRLRKQRQQLLAEQARLEERVQIGRDLHDALGADLVRINIAAKRIDDSTLAHDVQTYTADAGRTLREIIWSVSDQHTLDSVIAVVIERMRAMADDAGLEFELDMSTTESSPLSTSMSTPMPTSIPTWNLDAQHARNIVMITSEATTNVIKHAKATKLTLSVFCIDNAVHVVIRDNGQGMQHNATSPTFVGGRGLGNMRSRAAQSNIMLDITTAQPHGTVVTLIIQQGSENASSHR
ncbi:MAG: hypothetical protein J5I53_09650 [Bradyrhizobiaceae bacterium]|nr:hypothetical protein [Bradyrhizobiaceae bacterium]